METWEENINEISILKNIKEKALHSVHYKFKEKNSRKVFKHFYIRSKFILSEKV
jgi:hypothetical protein